MKFKDLDLFYYWVIVVVIVMFFYAFIDEGLALIISVLMIPIFIHDILIKLGISKK